MINMVYEVLARKWRPQAFQDVIGQEHVTQTLMNAIKADRLAHAYLFSGARGVGKTSVARILAKAINCVDGQPGYPCNKCRSCSEISDGSSLDVREIDGASNRRIEEIRELRENIKYMPSSGRSRVYIIDEVHMLTREAFNALLKTLEEPPPHVKFIFATTDPHKVPITILSRCQRFDFKRIPLSLLVEQMEKISREETLEISKAGLALIAGKAEGSMRDAESLLDQVVSYAGRKAEEKQIADILGIVDRELLFETSFAIIEGSARKCLEIVDKIYNHGYDVTEFYRGLMDQFRNLLIVLIDPESDTLEITESHKQETRRQAELAGSERIHQALNLLIAREESLRLTSHSRLVLETILIKLCRIGELLSFEELLRKVEGLERRLTTSPPTSPDTSTMVGHLSDPPARWQTEENEKSQRKDWEGFLSFLSSRNKAMANVLRDWRLVNHTGNALDIAKGENSFSSSFLDEPERLNKLVDLCREFFGREMKINIVLNGSNGKPKTEKKCSDLPRPVQDVLDIFQGEVKEGFPARKTDVKDRQTPGTKRREKT